MCGFFSLFEQHFQQSSYESVGCGVFLRSGISAQSEIQQKHVRWNRNARKCRRVHFSAPRSSELEFVTDFVPPPPPSCARAVSYRRTQPTVFSLSSTLSARCRRSQLCWLDICYDHVRERDRWYLIGLFSGHWAADSVCVSDRGILGVLVAAGLDNRGRKINHPLWQPCEEPCPFIPPAPPVSLCFLSSCLSLTGWSTTCRDPWAHTL